MNLIFSLYDLLCHEFYGFKPFWHNLNVKYTQLIYSFNCWCGVSLLGSELVILPAPICSEEVGSMGRGVSCGGGQSSLGYLFGNEEAPKAAPTNPQPVPTEAEVMPPPKLVALPDVPKDIPAGIHSSSRNNYMRADGQNTGNILTDRPSTKVHAEPGGGSSLGYLFGGGSK
ncbi:hypothetical protein SAY86_003121 [Trapa natans]|uniref:Uncharacterized protein n=1 Tax=Trapa natans TaxID=22666 RepID=A0AAN7LGV2_TRANT|nr:hypothetical protein SAY86_003121 [Trapa natans]